MTSWDAIKETRQGYCDSMDKRRWDFAYHYMVKQNQLLPKPYRILIPKANPLCDDADLAMRLCVKYMPLVEQACTDLNYLLSRRENNGKNN